jgi:hypothetical protein
MTATATATATPTAVGNGRPRTSLASQLDRLDSILDGLADGLNEAVAQAVTAAVGLAVRQALQAVLTELLTNPQVLEPLRGLAAPAAPASASPSAPPSAPSPDAAPKPNLQQRFRRACSWVGGRLRAAYHGVAARLAQVRARSATLIRRTGRVTRAAWQGVKGALRLAGRLRYPLLLAAGAGVLVGVVAYLAGREVAAAASGVGGFVTALAAQAGAWLRGAVRAGDSAVPAP